MVAKVDEKMSFFTQLVGCTPARVPWFHLWVPTQLPVSDGFAAISEHNLEAKIVHLRMQELPRKTLHAARCVVVHLTVSLPLGVRGRK